MGKRRDRPLSDPRRTRFARSALNRRERRNELQRIEAVKRDRASLDRRLSHLAECIAACGESSDE